MFLTALKAVRAASPAPQDGTPPAAGGLLMRFLLDTGVDVRIAVWLREQGKGRLASPCEEHVCAQRSAL